MREEEDSGRSGLGVEEVATMATSKGSGDLNKDLTQVGNCTAFDKDAGWLLEFTENNLLDDALEELKFSSTHDAYQEAGILDEFNGFSSSEFTDLDKLLGSNVKLHGETAFEELSALNFDSDDYHDDVFFNTVFGKELASTVPKPCNEEPTQTHQGAFAGCTDFSCVLSDTTVVMTTSSSLGELMEASGICTDLKEANPSDLQLQTRKRKLPSDDDLAVIQKSPVDSETDFADCSSTYSSCVSSPEDKVSLRRQKNNEASKISRANRKAKQKELFEREKKLKKDNDRLRRLIEEMEKEAASLRTFLVDKLSSA